MFTSTKIVAAVTKTKIKVCAVKLGETSVIDRQEIFEWNTQSLATILQTIKQHFGPSIRILFSDEFVYLTTVKITISANATRETIRIAAQELIPEDLNKTSWDYRIYPEYIQVAVLQSGIYTQITDAVKKAEIHIEAIESYTNSLSRLTADESDPFILLFHDESYFLVIMNKGVALTTEVIHTALTPDQVERLVHFSEEHFGISIKKIIKTGSIGEFFTGEFFKNFTIETKQLNAAISTAMKTDIKVADSSSLNLEITSAPVHTFDRKILIPYLAFFVTFIITVITTYFGQTVIFKNDAKQESLNQAVTPTTQPTPIASPSAVMEEHFTIRILNGSGVETEADRLQTILAENNYDVIGADTTSTARGISIHYSARVDQLYLDELDKLLKNIYTTVTTPEAKLAPDEADITIIIGTFKPK